MRNLNSLLRLSPSHDGEGVAWPDRWPEITDARVRAAFLHVNRALYVPESVREWANRDAPLPIGEGQTVSQPFVIALMVQALDLQPGDRVLEVGTGSGYQTAILCELTHARGHPAGETVYSVERFPSLANTAMRDLRAAGYAPHVRMGDGAEGWSEAAPFAGIVVSAAAAWVPLALTEQLAPGGRLIIPVGPQGNEQSLWLIQRTRDGWLCDDLGYVRFVPLISPLLENEANRFRLPGRAGV